MTREEQWLLDEKYAGIQSEAFFADCKRLEKGEPVAYLIGTIPFLNTTISLDSHPLIPRPETEFWVEQAISEIRRNTIPTIHVLDLCAGSGAIGVAVLKAIPAAFVHFTEIGHTHVSTIRKNCEQNQIPSDRYTIHCGDLFSTKPPLDTTFNYILTNPPYIDIDAHTVDHNVATYEPALALFGGADGFAYITNIITHAKDHLTRDGVLYIEHEPTHVSRIKQTAQVSGLSADSSVDQYGVYRFSRLMIQ